MNWNLVILRELGFYFLILMTNLLSFSLVCGAVIWLGEHSH